MTWQRQEELRAEFMREQLWQFISIDEWLDANEKLDEKAHDEKGNHIDGYRK